MSPSDDGGLLIVRHHARVCACTYDSSAVRSTSELELDDEDILSVTNTIKCTMKIAHGSRSDRAQCHVNVCIGRY